MALTWFLVFIRRSVPIFSVAPIERATRQDVGAACRGHVVHRDREQQAQTANAALFQRLA
jgi:hypothetical protein